LKDFILIVY